MDKVPPPHPKNFNNSVDVLVRRGNLFHIGYYDFLEERWAIYDDITQRYIVPVKKIKEWLPLPKEGEGIS